MTPHARPHIETHNRSRGHSAVAGAAYRMGLSLLDARTGTCHTYARRRRGGEIIAAFTIAPDGAPSWATDPAECWNRAEAAERRKDAQVARDYRIPVPLGLDDQAAAAMARDMAEHIAARFAVPVSVGVHRDNSRDALGAMKPAEKRGFHAHLYFPTRRLDGDHYGAKLSELSNKTTSAPLVDTLNQRWAELANTYTARAGLVADYDHRAHARAGDSDEPTPTLGVAACAMERRGIETDKGADMKLLERLRLAAKKASNANTEASSEPTTTTEEAGGQAGSASPRLVATQERPSAASDARRARAEQSARAAMTAENVAETMHSRTAYEAERRRKRLAQWLGEHPRPRWFLFWLRPRWERSCRKLQRAVARQEQRERHAQKARKAAHKAYEEKRQRLTALSAKPYIPPIPSLPRERLRQVPAPRLAPALGAAATKPKPPPTAPASNNARRKGPR